MLLRHCCWCGPGFTCLDLCPQNTHVARGTGHAVIGQFGSVLKTNLARNLAEFWPTCTILSSQDSLVIGVICPTTTEVCRYITLWNISTHDGWSTDTRGSDVHVARVAGVLWRSWSSRLPQQRLVQPHARLRGLVRAAVVLRRHQSQLLLSVRGDRRRHTRRHPAT